MTQEQLNEILNSLIENWEDEVTEFKQAKNDYSNCRKKINDLQKECRKI